MCFYISYLVKQNEKIYLNETSDTVKPVKDLVRIV